MKPESEGKARDSQVGYPLKPRGLDLYSKFVLTAIATLLAVLAFRPVMHPQTAWAASAASSDFYVEPGTTAVRKPDGTQQVEAKILIDMKTGDVCGFPTLGPLPYPVDPTHSQPPVSAPILPGELDLAKAIRTVP